MSVINDIRLYKGKHAGGVENGKMNLSAHRVAMKLREKEFVPGDYDHLYLCFYTDEPVGTVILDENINRYFPWFREVKVGISPEDYKSIETDGDLSVLFRYMENVLLALFGNDSEKAEMIKYALEEAKKGPEMLMHFKEKKGAKGTATVYLRQLDEGPYLPLLVVTRLDGTEVLRVNLPETRDLGSMGEIQLSSKKVTVKPRKSSYTKDLVPVSFEISL